MFEMPGVSLGGKLVMEHLAPTVRGAVVTVTAQCTKRRGDGYWEWDVVVVDDHEVLALVTLGFVADIDVKRYSRRLAAKLAALPIGVRVWLRILDALALISVMAIPVQVAYVWHGWASMVIVETFLIVGWLVGLTGLPFAVGDWLTIRRRCRTHPDLICLERDGRRQR